MIMRRLGPAFVLWLPLMSGAAAWSAPPTPAPSAPNSTATSPTAAPSAPNDDDDGPPRFSLPTESERAMWKRPGFRFGLGLVYGRLTGINGAPNKKLIGPTIRLGLRLDEDWSIMASLQYLYATGAADATGLRFAGTIEPTWHVTDHLSLAAGIGFAGLVEASSWRPDPGPLPDTLDTSYTYPSSRPPMSKCNGLGVGGLLRAEWMMVLGPRSSTGFAFEVDGQWTECVDDTGRLEPDNAKPIVRRQGWSHLGGSLAWGILWR
jgi:hypothetical protein